MFKKVGIMLNKDNKHNQQSLLLMINGNQSTEDIFIQRKARSSVLY